MKRFAGSLKIVNPCFCRLSFLVAIKYMTAAAFILGLVLTSCYRQEPAATGIEEVRERVLRGWNTWDVTSISTQVLLPEGLALNLQINDSLSGRGLKLMFTGNQSKDSEKVRVRAHTPDGSYTDYELRWLDFALRIQTCSDSGELCVLVSPLDESSNQGVLQVNASMLYEREGEISREGKGLLIHCPDRIIRVYPVSGELLSASDSTLLFAMDDQLAYSTQNLSPGDLRKKISRAEAGYLEKKAAWGELSEVYDAVQNVINWTLIYDNVDHRPLTPVARPWAYGWGGRTPGGYVLFCWDNFFAAFLHSMESKELAFNEAIVMCDEIDDLGFVPNFSATAKLKSRDRSQPPVGSMMVKEIYLRHSEKWFLERTFGQLLAWNRWWEKKRNVDGYLCWGSNPFEPVLDDRREKVSGNFRAASYESGLDNTPMHDGVPFDTTTWTLMQGDVGLMGLYVGDCEALAFIAKELGRDKEARELVSRARTYRQKLETMWNEEAGIFLNYRIDLQEPSLRISPTNFYPLIARAATQEQARRMMEEHFYNPDEFWGRYIMPSIARNDTAYTGMDYWRGSIWAPMNFLVYLGMRNYDLPKARRDMALKSRALLLDEWNRDHYVRENYHAETGTEPGSRSNPFYHWGALLGMIELMEHGDY